MTPRAAIESWDSGQQPDLERLARLIRDLSDGRCHLYPVDTGMNEYAVVVSNMPLSEAEVQQLWERSQTERLPDIVELAP